MGFSIKKGWNVLSFPLLFLGGVSLMVWLFEQGYSWLLVSGSILVLVSIFVGALEQIIPYEKSWANYRDDLGTDLLYVSFNTILNPIFMALNLWLFNLVGSWLASSVFHFSLWPKNWPFWGQVALAFGIAEFFLYWAHRISHEANTILRRFHAIHHTPQKLYFLSTYRLHWGDLWATLIIGYAPLLLLGVEQRIIDIIGFIGVLHSIFAHANLDFRLGPLNHIFSMSELHRWHHSKDPWEQNHNYGAVLIIWDSLFQTRYLPNQKLGDKALGLQSGKKHPPHGFFPQFLHPLKHYFR